MWLLLKYCKKRGNCRGPYLTWFSLPRISQGPLLVGAYFRSGPTFGQSPLLVWIHFWSGPTFGRGPLLVGTHLWSGPTFSRGPFSVGAYFRSGLTFGLGPLSVLSHFWLGPTVGLSPLLVWAKKNLGELVFCYQNCSDLLWEKIVLVIEKNLWNSRLDAENLQNFWNQENNLFKQWKVRTIFGKRMLF